MTPLLVLGLSVLPLQSLCRSELDRPVHGSVETSDQFPGHVHAVLRGSVYHLGELSHSMLRVGLEHKIQKNRRPTCVRRST